MTLAKMFGSNDGDEPSARTSPVFAFITANAPRQVPPERLLAGLLHVEVERQPQVAALLGSVCRSGSCRLPSAST